MRALDELAEFEEYRQSVLAAIRRDLKDGKDSEAIIKKYSAQITARVATIALTDRDNKTALAAAKDLQDRGLGKPKETHDFKHKLENLPEEQLDSILLSKLKSLKNDEEEKH